ncbi:MAG: YciI family protein [Acidobacteriales bacterium]|nr:YciI family protein [Terriglobales bacterium]
MKFICLGYTEEKKWEAMTRKERDAKMEECLAYDDVLRKNGHVLGGEALESVSKARTLRYRNGKVLVTDGPYAETKEQLGGLFILEARDLDQAIQLLSKHPGVRFGPLEIRAADEEINQMIAERRRATSSPDVKSSPHVEIDLN